MLLSLSTLLRQTARFRRSPVRLRSLPRVLFKRSARSLRLRFLRRDRGALTDALTAANLDCQAIVERLPDAGTFVVPSDATLDTLRQRDPVRARSTIEAAERLLRHEFRLLGSETYIPRHPETPAGSDGYQPIDWYLDPVSGLRFPEGVPHTEWDLYAMRPGLADVKLPWELARCQHWPTLGQAYRLTRDSRYAVEIARQMADFDTANPPGIGINWTCTMDVALRALNWTLGLALVHDCEALSPRFWNAACATLFDHGRFIMDNLENTYEVTSNHYLSNLVGLYPLGKLFQPLAEGKRWESFCFESLHREIEVQTLADGADFESSVPYHRLVAELFLSSARLGEATGTPFSAAYNRRLGEMVDYLAAVVRPDGLLPQLGDADDGRAHVLTDYGTWNPQDGRHLFAPAALHLGRPEWLALAGDGGAWEAAWWGFDVSSRPDVDEGPAYARLFPDAGVAAIRDGDHMVLITNGVVGTKGFGNHKHNDQLSFEYHLEGQPIVVDPGSYVYTSDPDARNLFRGTGYHNTITVDDEEQNELNPEWLFRMFESAEPPEHLELDDDAESVRYRGRHSGYARLRPGVVHERLFHFDRATGSLHLVDTILGEGSHHLRWHFHFAPGVEIEYEQPGVVAIAVAGRELALIVPPTLQTTISAAWYSPSYGVRVPCQAAEMELETTIAGRATWRFQLGPRPAHGERSQAGDPSAHRPG